MNLKFQNPKFSILSKIAFIWNANPLEFRGQWGFSKTSKSGRIGLGIYASIF